ncbi:hypothetical protein LWI28_001515 [Acer negundo]|uniref:Pentatricopeptide repeat-containing protein n=1 Tax=Acer negundo TaxID=4023 RepID=A0AAD5NGQ9_ACENE|nr:hypothetical protein LWI28_001515 [Acer negundo]KAK4839893.1 hypothetical protein QYF36_025791 [Acer negundo]
MGNDEEVEVCFSEMDRRDDFSWNILISFYSSRGNVKAVVDKFNAMQSKVAISIETLSLVISVFGKSGNVVEGKNLHGFAIKAGLCDDVLLNLLDFHAKCGELGNAAQLFSEIPHRNNITWNAMMSGFVQNGHFNEAIELFRQIEAAGLEPDAVILRSLVDAYSNLGVLQWVEFGVLYLQPKEFTGTENSGNMWHRPDNAGYYTLLCNIQASVGQWIEVEEVKESHE